MENKLCTIEKITEILPIKDADKIINVRLGDWSVVSQKDQYKVGDLVIMIRPDAVLPQNLIDKYDVAGYLKKGTRVRVVKLKGCYSECLLLPISELTFTGHLGLTSTISVYTEGTEVSKELNIVKYEEPIKESKITTPKVRLDWSKWYSLTMWKKYFKYLIYNQLFKKTKSSNPNFHKYYKFENKKNVKGMFNENDDVIITEKIHGTNFRCGIVERVKFTRLERFKKLFGFKIDKYTFVYGSHNVELGNGKTGWYSEDVYGKIVKQYDLERQLDFTHKLYKKPVVIYGEIFGPGIQKDYSYGQEELKLRIFDITIDNEYQSEKVFTAISQSLGLPMVPTLFVGKYSEDIVNEMTIGKSTIDGKTVREGCVVKCLSGSRNKIFKSINPEYKILQDKKDLTDFH